MYNFSLMLLLCWNLNHIYARNCVKVQDASYIENQ